MRRECVPSSKRAQLEASRVYLEGAELERAMQVALEAERGAEGFGGLGMGFPSDFGQKRPRSPKGSCLGSFMYITTIPKPLNSILWVVLRSTFY